jgi:hypothetical protein
MKKAIFSVFAIFSCFSTLCHAQSDGNSFTNTGRGCATTFATDYQAIGTNPANLGWKPKYETKFTMGYAEFAGSVFSDSLGKSSLRKAVTDMITGNSANLDRQQKLQAASNFTQSDFIMNADVTSFGFAVQTKHAGGFAFRINDHFQWYSKLGSDAASLIFLGNTSSLFNQLTIKVGSSTQTINNHPGLSPDTANMVVQGTTNAPKLLSKILDGSHMQMTWYREYNLSYGAKLLGKDSVFAIYGGLGVKYIQGMAMFDIKSEGGVLTGFSSLSPSFGVDYGTAAAQAKAVAGGGFPPKSVGNGFGVDMGASIIIKGRLKLGVSLINVGAVSWTGNVYQLKDTMMVSLKSSGVQNLNLATQMKNMLGPDGMFKVTGQQSYKTVLPGMFRTGASLRLTKQFEVGVDAVIPTNTTVPGSIKNPILAAGVDFMPVKWLKLQTGIVVGGNYPYQIPVGVVFIGKGGHYEAGIASRDAVTFFIQQGSTMSFSTGFMRFRF